VYPAVLLKNFISVDVSRVLILFSEDPNFPRVQISLPYELMGRASALYTFILENFWTKVGLKVLFTISSI
jgi:hypothetical protein